MRRMEALRSGTVGPDFVLHSTPDLLFAPTRIPRHAHSAEQRTAAAPRAESNRDSEGTSSPDKLTAARAYCPILVATISQRRGQPRADTADYWPDRESGGQLE